MKREIIGSSYDDGSAVEELEENFESIVYKNWQAMYADLYRMGRDPYKTRTQTGWVPRKPEETERILQAQIEAKARFRTHRCGKLN